MPHDATEITRLLDAASRGQAQATEQLLPLVYDELRRLAGGLMSRERPGQTLQPTALVHEAYMRLLGSQPLTWQNRAHFFGAAATAMRRILIDRARHVKAARVKAVAADVDALVSADGFGPGQDADDLIALDAALVELAARDQRQHDVVMLRYFAGLTIEQTAEALSISTGTVKNEWSYARAWLLHQIEKRAERR